MESKYLEYKDEIVSLFWNGNGYQAIAQHLIDKYHLKINIESKELKTLSKIDSTKRIYKILDEELKTLIHSIQILIS